MHGYIRSSSPDLIHVNGSQDHWVAGLVNGFLHRRVCVVRSRHNTYVVKDNLANRLLNRRWTTFQICVCEMVRETLGSHRAFDTQRMTSIHNGVDAEMYRPDAASRNAARKMFGYEPEHLVCGIAARLVKAKGHTFLFEAFSQLHTTNPRARLLVLGQGVLEDALKQQVNELGLSDVVIFAGYRNDMATCIQALDIGVLPSIDCDTSSFSLKEQMAAEIPVVTSDYGGLPEIVTDGEEGLVVPHGTIAPLVEALRTLLENDTLRRELGRKGRQRVLREFTGAVFANRTLEAYATARELTNERHSS